ncbi:ureidoglycolate lyase [Paradevosia shaoguanensis]|uniref:ureidoglycolate lyase n=1 Tax=Paradevosia shaoguanensis TaxID=1335043 RepID=UPI001932D42F|nr:ureidoglycolate lyase [Paradevosia shaoguanensis]
MKLQPLTPGAAEPFAYAIRAVDGKMTEVPMVNEIGDVPGRHVFTVLAPKPVPADAISITFLERHPHSTQSFLPLRVGRWLVVVAPTLPSGDPDLANVRAFVAGPEDAICIARNAWHAGLTVLDQPAEFGMQMWRSDAGDDGVVFTLDQPLTLSL